MPASWTLVLPSLFWLSYAESTSILPFFLFFWPWSLYTPVGTHGEQTGGAREAREGGRVGGGRSIEAPGSAPKRLLGSLSVGGGAGERVGSPIKRRKEPVGRGVRERPGSTRERNTKHHLPCNAIYQGGVTWTANVLPRECFSVHHVTLCWPVRSMFHI